MFEEKIAQVRDLIAERDEIDAQLDALLGGALKPPTVRDRQASTSIEHKSKKVKNKCSQCGESGHTKRTCRVSGGSAPIPREDKSAEPITEDQFDELKHLSKTGQLSSREFAEEQGVSLAEVNRAITSRSYEEYSG